MVVFSTSPCGPLTLPRLAVIFAFLCGLYLVRDIWMPPSPASISKHETQQNIVSQWPGADNATKQSGFNDDECLNVPGSDKVMVILKVSSLCCLKSWPLILIAILPDGCDRDLREASHTPCNLVPLYSSLFNLFRLGPNLLRLPRPRRSRYCQSAPQNQS